MHSDIFGRQNVTGARVLALWNSFEAVAPALDEIDNKQFAHYTLTRYLLAYVVASLIRSDPIGAAVMDNLDKVVENGRLSDFVTAFSELAVAAANDLNAEVAVADDEIFDHKTQLKSAKWCRATEARILGSGPNKRIPIALGV